MKILRSKLVIPRFKFLEKIDRYLLVNFPRLWDSRIHYVLFYGLLANIFIGLIVYTLFRPKLDFNAGYANYYSPGFNLTGLVWLIIIPEAIVFISWFYTQSYFNIEGEHGNTHYTFGLIETLIFLVCGSLIFSPSLTALVVGINKTAYAYGLNKQTTCDGPSILKFYAPNFLNQPGLDANNIRIALKMAEEAVLTGKAEEGRVWIEQAAILPEESEVYVYTEENRITVYNRSRILIEDGEAEVHIEGSTYPITIKTSGVIKSIQPNELTILSKGDEIINYFNLPASIALGNFQERNDYTNARTPIIYLTKGTLTVRLFQEIVLEKGDALIRETGKELILVEGESTTEMNSQKSELLNDNAFDTCLELKYFHAKEKPEAIFYSDRLGYSLFLSWHILFVILGAFLLTTLKHGGWLNVAYIIIYWLLQIFAVALFSDLSGGDTLGLSSKLGMDRITSWFDLSKAGYASSDIERIVGGILIISLLIYGLIQFTRISRILRTKKYRRITFLRLASLPIEAGFILLVTTLSIYQLLYPGEIIEDTMIYVIILLAYIPLAALQKRMFIFLMSLPKG